MLKLFAQGQADGGYDFIAGDLKIGVFAKAVDKTLINQFSCFEKGSVCVKQVVIVLFH